MNWQHLSTVLWLRWRMSKNQWRRAGALNLILMIGLISVALVSSFFAFLLGIVAGVIWLSEVDPDILLLVWSGFVVVFVVAWTITLLAEVQRSELLSLDKLLHFPMSLSGAFALNYVSSLFSVMLAVAVPGMLGLSIGMVWNRGPTMLLLFPLVFAFVFMVTGVTYQLRGWLVTLMENKRRRRTIIMVFTIGIIGVTQIPNLVNLAFMKSRNQSNSQRVVQHNERLLLETSKVNKRLTDGEISIEESQRLMKELTKRLDDEQQEANEAEWKAIFNQVVRYCTIACQSLPIGWLPYGARQAAAGSVWPGMLCALGMTSVGVASLWRSYHTTMRHYTGAGSKARRPTKETVKAELDDKPRRIVLVERRISGLSEHASAVTMATFRSLLRAPEAKMALVMPVIMVMIFGAMFLFGPLPEVPAIAHPFIAVGAIAMSMFGLATLLINVFGADRHAFRAYVLMPVARKDILIGKNLAVVPFGLSMMFMLLVVIQVLAPLTITNLIATLLQTASAFLLFCLIGNFTSILAPMVVAIGTSKPVHPKLGPALLHGMAVMLAPACFLPGLLALAGETLIAETLDFRLVPIYLIVSTIECGAVLWLYPRVLQRQGRWLQKREPLILETVTANVE